MKIILSRKGFDSAYGGYPSPILDDGRMVSLPIPYPCVARYGDLKFDEKHSYYEIMKQLRPTVKDKRKWNILTKETPCHFDPDIYQGANSCFGQSGAAQGHLKKEGVKVDDLFLFFGWFRQTICENGVLRFSKSAQDLQVIFGYLQIGEIIEVNEKSVSDPRIKNHCHVLNEHIRKLPNNTIYLARENLSWNKDLPGAGVFDFAEKRVLTMEGCSRSRWKLPDSLRNVKISRHSQASWREEGYFQSAPIGQEFVIKGCDFAKEWAKGLFD